jgi:hypothetical protein
MAKQPGVLSAGRAALRNLGPRVRLRLALAASALALGFAAFAACGGCRTPRVESTAASSPSAVSSSRGGPARADVDAGVLVHDPLLWSHASGGDIEDLATLAAHEGAAGLVEATEDAAVRTIAIRAMAYAAGWAQLPYLVKVAGGKDDAEARLALDSTLELAARPRRAEDPEDADELREGCDGLGALARDPTRARPRRVSAVRALRMMACPPTSSAELPADLDAK